MMSRKLTSSLFALLVVLTTLGIGSGSASAASSQVFATPGAFTCKPATAANEIAPPPPMWELSGEAPSAQEVETANATPPLCPPGQVPSEIKQGPATADLMPKQGGTSENLLAGGVVPPALGGENCGSEGCYWYANNEVSKNAIGMEYETDISEPHVSSFAEAHSIDQLAVAAGTEGNQYTIEAGWDVDPDKWESSPKPHFFIFVNPDKYGSESCYDCHFVSATEAKITPGAALEPSTSRFKIGVKYTGGDWWIWAGTQWIGYVPASAWGGHFTKGTREVNYGEVFDNEEHPTSAMGDGQFGSSASATFMTQSLVTFPAGEEETTGYHGEATNSSLYSIGDINSGKTEWHFGGPGDPTPPSVTTEGATNIEAPHTTLHGSVTPEGIPTTYYFQYGTTTNWNEASTSLGEAGSGYSGVKESTSVGGLWPYTTYYDRIVASNAGGTNYGGGVSFKTGPPANGSLWRVSNGPNQGELLIAAGGALIPVTECSGEVGCSGYTEITSEFASQYETAHPLIANSTVVRVGNGKNAGEISTVAGGVPIPVLTECGGEVSCSGYVNVDSKGLKGYEEAHPLIANSTVVRVGNGKNAGEISIAAGGAILEVNECTLLNGCAGWINVDSKGLKSYEEAHPTIANGTYLLGLPSKKTWIIEGGKREETGSHGGSVTVTDVMLEKIPKG